MQTHISRRFQLLVAAILIAAFGFFPLVTTSAPRVLSTTFVTTTTETIRVNTHATPTLIDPRVRGTNLPAWLNPTRLNNTTFQERTRASGTSVMRIPGGSWSNAYNWLGCETGNSSTCYWTWAARPSDFMRFMRDTNSEGMYIVNFNGTAKEAAAVVAFFNGAVNDERTIGVDLRGRDWYTVGHWARLRRDQGYPEPFKITLWEVGNEIYGGRSGQGKDCLPWGWEDVWTCDGTEYVEGIGSGSNRREGYREFRNAMRAVDPSIMVGAVGVSEQSDWSNWGNEVIAAAGSEMDFYSIHHYAYNNPPANLVDALHQPQRTWKPMLDNVHAAFDQHAAGRRVPIAITEHNMFAMQEQDSGQFMTRAVNALFIADTLGQMMQHGVAMANQWNLANGQAWNGTDYGLMNQDTFARYPQYYVFPLWARFGDRMLPATWTLPADTTLSVYAGRIDDTTFSLLAINKTDQPIFSAIELDGITTINGASADVVRATALNSQLVTFNGVSDPASDLANAPAQTLTNLGNPFTYTFEPYSITLLRINASADSSTAPSSTPLLPTTTVTTESRAETSTPLPPTATVTNSPTPTQSLPVTQPGEQAPIYTDTLANGWQNWSWNTSTNFANPDPRSSGAASLAVTYNSGWAGLYLRNNQGIATTAYDTLRFQIHGGSTGGQQIQLWLRDAQGHTSPIIRVTPAANTWTQVDVLLADMGLTQVNDIVLQDISSGAQPTFYLDDIAFITAPTDQPTRTATATHTSLPTSTATNQPTRTATATHTPLPTSTATNQPTRTATATHTPPLTSTQTPAPVPPGEQTPVYTDTLANGWQNWSWNTSTNFANPDPRSSGAASLAVTYNSGWAGLYLRNNQGIATTAYDTLRFQIHGGSTGGQQIQLWLRDAQGHTSPIIRVTPAANTWTQVDVLLADIGLAHIYDIVWQEATGRAQPTFYLDEIVLITTADN